MAAGAYVLGRGNGADVDGARSDGRAEGYATARDVASRRGYERGYAESYERGFKAAYRRSYRVTYQSRVKALRKKQQAAATEPAAQEPSGAAAPPGSRYTDQLPNGRPGYVLPEDQRTLACIGVDAATGECIGD